MHMHMVMNLVYSSSNEGGCPDIDQLSRQTLAF